MRDVNELYDPKSNVFVFPKKRLGKSLIEDVFSFSKIREISEVKSEEIDRIRNLSENKIEFKLRAILEELNPTPHSPAERTDVFALKLKLNNVFDLRNAGFIIKGKGYPKITLKDFAHNLLKTLELSIEIVFYVYTGSARAILSDSAFLFRDR